MQFDHHLLSRHAYGLADPALVEYLPDGLGGVPLVPPLMRSSAHLMPRLLDLRTMPAPARDGLLGALYVAHQHAEQPPVPMFIATEAGADAFVRHWNGLQLATTAPDRKVWLRLHDPRVLHQLMRMLSEQQRRRLFGPADGIAYWLGDAWLSARPEDDAASGGATDGPLWPWARIERIGAINRALQGAGIWRAAAINAQAARAERLIERAAGRYGIGEQADLVEFAVRGLLTSDTFDEHPDVARAIRAGSGPDGDALLADRLALIDEQIWAELGHTDHMD